MTSRDFCYWLQGHFEIADTDKLSEAQVKMIKRHLALVFKHEIDPSYGGNQSELQAIHDGNPPPFPPNNSMMEGEEPLIRC